MSRSLTTLERGWERASQAEGTAHTRCALWKVEAAWQMQLNTRPGQNLRGLESLVFSLRALGNKGRAYAEGDMIRSAY